MKAIVPRVPDGGRHLEHNGLGASKRCSANDINQSRHCDDSTWAYTLAREDMSPERPSASEDPSPAQGNPQENTVWVIHYSCLIFRYANRKDSGRLNLWSPFPLRRPHLPCLGLLK